MRIFLDDIREEPEGWFKARWPQDVILQFLDGMEVEEISLDYDLGDERIGTGYDVLKWLYNVCDAPSFSMPKIRIHTTNEAHVKKLRDFVRVIEGKLGKSLLEPPIRT